MRTKIIAAFVAGGLLVGAGFLTSAISAPGTAQAQDESPDGSEGLAGPEDHVLRPALGFLDDVLDGLVADGTLDQEQADAVVDAVEEKAREFVEEHRDDFERFREEGREQWRSFGKGLHFGALLDDGAIDQEEYDALDDDHPLKQIDVSEYLEDGSITRDEFRAILSDLWESHQDD
jgi:polyhydroxyalkanoate synthesis regulator phasin